MLDRNLQRKFLEQLRDEYPRSAFVVRELDEKVAAANLQYLEEHGLCESGVLVGADNFISFGMQKITARGLDFLADDGGLSAILGTVVVKLHADTIHALLEAKIEQTDLPAAEKFQIRQRLATLPTTALEAATKQLVEAGLAHLPDAVGWLRALIGL